MRSLHKQLLLMVLALSLLTGCLYPKGELTENKIPHDSQLQAVQEAVDSFREDTNGLLPIKTKESDVNIYEKYIIDFTALKDGNYIPEVPGNAFESGGVYQYTIINPEDNPTVKLIDLRMTDQLRQVNVKLDIYRSKNLYPPYGEQIADNLYRLNYEKIGFKEEPLITSPFSEITLPLVMDTDGVLYIDYKTELDHALQSYDHSYETGDDIRNILPAETPFVPAYSLPYTVEEDEAVFLIK